MFGFSFAFDWLIDFRECLRPHRRRSEAKLMQSPNIKTVSFYRALSAASVRNITRLFGFMEIGLRKELLKLKFRVFALC